MRKQSEDNRFHELQAIKQKNRRIYSEWAEKELEYMKRKKFAREFTYDDRGRLMPVCRGRL